MLITLKQSKKKAEADADVAVVAVDSAKEDVESKKIDNADKLIGLWEKYAEQKSQADKAQIDALTLKLAEFETLANSLRKEVVKLTKAINAAKLCSGVADCPALKKLNETE